MKFDFHTFLGLLFLLVSNPFWADGHFEYSFRSSHLFHIQLIVQLPNSMLGSFFRSFSCGYLTWLLCLIIVLSAKLVAYKLVNIFCIGKKVASPWCLHPVMSSLFVKTWNGIICSDKTCKFSCLRITEFCGFFLNFNEPTNFCQLHLFLLLNFNQTHSECTTIKALS